MVAPGRAPARCGVARFEARFRLLPWPLTRVQRIWLLFASIDVPRRIARERVLTMGVDLTPYVDAWAAAGRDFCGLVGLLLVGRLFGRLIPSDPIT